MYRVAMAATSPIVRSWGRLEVSGLEHMPESGPVLLAGNHDSYWDPLSIGIAGLPRRQVCALAKSELWKVPLLDRILNGMGQIPIDRGAGDAHALDRAVAELEKGRCIGVFLEGTRSRGSELRARSGFGRLAERVPDAQIVSCTVEGTTDVDPLPQAPAHQGPLLHARRRWKAGGGVPHRVRHPPARGDPRLRAGLGARAQGEGDRLKTAWHAGDDPARPHSRTPSQWGSSTAGPSRRAPH